MNEMIARDQDLLEVMSALTRHAARLIERPFDPGDIRTLKHVRAGYGEEIQQLLRICIDGFDAEEHPRGEINIARRHALRNR